MRLLACLIVAPQRGYDEPAILSYAISSFCPTSADGLQLRAINPKVRPTSTRSRVCLRMRYRAPDRSCLGPHQRLAAALLAGKGALSRLHRGASGRTDTSCYACSACSAKPASFLPSLQAILRNSAAWISSSATYGAGEGAVVGSSKFDHGCRIDSRLLL